MTPSATESTPVTKPKDVVGVEIFIVEPEVALVAEPKSRTTGALLLNTNIGLRVLHVRERGGMTLRKRKWRLSSRTREVGAV